MIPGRSGDSASGLAHIMVDKACKIGARWCERGSIVKVERVSKRIMPVDDRLDDKHAQHLVDCGYAHIHQIRHGDKIVSVEATPPKPLPSGNELRELEVATDPRPKQAQQAVTQRGQRGAL